MYAAAAARGALIMRFLFRDKKTATRRRRRIVLLEISIDEHRWRNQKITAGRNTTYHKKDDGGHRSKARCMPGCKRTAEAPLMGGKRHPRFTYFEIHVGYHAKIV